MKNIALCWCCHQQRKQVCWLQDQHTSNKIAIIFNLGEKNEA